jgi:hypothetical protein
MERFGWTEGKSKKTGKPFWACKDGRTQWNPPNLDKEEKKYCLLKKYENCISTSFLPLSVKHLVTTLVTLDYKDMDHMVFNVLDVGSCNDNKHETFWKKECCSEYHCMDVKPSTFRGNFLAPLTWEKVGLYDIICLYDCLQAILYEDDFEEFFKRLEKSLKSDGRCILLIKKEHVLGPKKLELIKKSGFRIDLTESVSKLLYYIGVDSERIDDKRQLEWKLFYDPILQFYHGNEGLGKLDWFYASQYEVIILQKKTSSEITNLIKSLAIFL